MTIEDDIMELKKNQHLLEKKLNPRPLTNMQIVKSCGKGYLSIATCVALYVGFTASKKEPKMSRFGYACGVGICWPLLAVAMLAFTHK